ncbi:MAG: hypothetical protein ACXAC7_20280, partial [Candidatus Hodarchaeales archaeon]
MIKKMNYKAQKSYLHLILLLMLVVFNVVIVHSLLISITKTTTEEEQRSSTKTITETNKPMKIQEANFKGSNNDIPKEYPSQELNHNQRLEESYSISNSNQDIQSELKRSNYKRNKITFSSSPISIDGNGDFATKASSNGWIGDGSVSNPYILEHLVITTSVESTHAISIQNTDVYFILRNSTLTATGTGSSGLYLINVHN